MRKQRKVEMELTTVRTIWKPHSKQCTAHTLLSELCLVRARRNDETRMRPRPLVIPSVRSAGRKVKGTSSAYPVPGMFSTWLRLDSITDVKASNSSTCSVLHMLQIFLRATKAYSRTLKLGWKHCCSAIIRACFRTGFWKERGEILHMYTWTVPPSGRKIKTPHSPAVVTGSA